MKQKAAFIMPLKISGSEKDIRDFRASISAIENQTDPDWDIILVEDFSNDEKVYQAIDDIKAKLKDRIHVIYSDKNYGTGPARNKGVLYAKEKGYPFILFNDSDDLSDPRRLELVRKAFDEDESVNVVYTSFDIIDENSQSVSDDKIPACIKEIIDGHKVDPVEGECAWAQIAMKKKYTNLTSCTAVRTLLASAELFPNASVSEDCHTWMRYGAHPGKFHLIKEIIGHYRIRLGTQSRSRSINKDFYEKMYLCDCDGFEQALKLAKKYGTMPKEYDELELRTAQRTRLTLNLYNSGNLFLAERAINDANAISKELTKKYINLLPCDSQIKKEIANLIK